MDNNNDENKGIIDLRNNNNNNIPNNNNSIPNYNSPNMGGFHKPKKRFKGDGRNSKIALIIVCCIAGVTVMSAFLSLLIFNVTNSTMYESSGSSFNSYVVRRDIVESGSSQAIIGSDISEESYVVNYNNVIINESFPVNSLQNIDIEVVSADVYITRSDDEFINVEITQEDTNNTEISFQSDDSKIVVKEKTNKGFNFDFASSNAQVYITIPVNYSKDIEIRTISGIVEISNMENEFNEVDIESTSGDVSVLFVNANEIKLKTVSGDIDSEMINSKQLEVDSVSGRMEIYNLVCDNTVIESVSGDIYVAYAGDVNKIDLKTSSVSTKPDFNGIEISSQSDTKLEIKTISGHMNIGL